ncbi:MAG: ATPase [Oscillatoriales cyanobacterium RU_3_3]|nr:ATPase [Oscillatoriales cyanobacterium RU_3_3]
MDVKEVLKFTDNLVFAKTGKHLDDLQETVLRGVWQGRTYTQIAEESDYSEGYIREIASKLWQILSNKLGEKVNKLNFISTMERYQISHNSNFLNYNFLEKGNINFCTETLHHKQHSPPTQTPNKDNTQEKPRLDLRDAPELKTFYDRPSSPLAALETWILEQNCHLLTITGMSGTGKSSIARHLIPQIQTQFDRIIWRSLRTSPPLEITIKNIIQFLLDTTDINFPINTDAQLSILIETLRENRCLIILDDVQQILSSGQLAGNYKPDYENYGTLFKLIGELPHNSCLILNTWEPPSDILTFTDDNSAVRLLQLTGLGEAASEILRAKGLLDEDRWPDLIELYQGNPLWLKLVSQTINNLFGGKVAEYLSYEPVFLCDKVGQILQQHYQRLSEIEKQAIALIGNETELLSLTQLMAKCQGSQGELFTAIQSLTRRGMLQKLSYETETVFNIQHILKNMLKWLANSLKDVAK